MNTNENQDSLTNTNDNQDSLANADCKQDSLTNANGRQSSLANADCKQDSLTNTNGKQSSFIKTVRVAFPFTVPVLTGFLVLGIAYGMLMSAAGFGPLWIAAFSAIAFGGSMQFVAITFLSGQFLPFQAFLMSIAVNARHLFYSLSMLEKYKGAGKLKFFLIYWLCDETFALTSSVKVPEGIKPAHFYFAITVMDMLYWVLAGVLGGLLGHVLTVDTTGLDFALTALFTVLFIEQLKTKNNAICGLIGMAAGVVSLLIFGADNMVIPAMVIIFAALLGGKSKLCA